MLSYACLQEAFAIEKSFQNGKIPPSLISYMNRKGVAFMSYEKMKSALLEGKKSFRPSWKEGEFLTLKNNEFIKIEDSVENTKKPYQCNSEDLTANDWLIVEEHVL